MKDRYVKNEGGEVKLISISKIEENDKNISRIEGRVSSVNEKIDNAENGSEKQLGLIAERVRLETELAGYYDLKDYYDTFGIIAVKDADFGSSGSPSWWIIEGDSVRKPNTVELDARETERQASDLADKLDELWQACYSYQLKCIDVNTEAELSYARALVAGGAPVASFPKTAELGKWKKDLYGLPTDAESVQGTYYGRKNALLAGNEYSLDFSNFGDAPSSYSDLATENATYEASL